MQQRQKETAKLREELEKVAKIGSKIVDKRNGKTIGTVVSTPAPGTLVLLAQMRLDEVGLLENADSQWSMTNKVTIGDDNREWRYLPYIPIWWPRIDSKTGKPAQS